MTDAPERIWAWGYSSTDRDNRPCDERGWDEDDYGAKWYAEHGIALTEYTRADLAPTDAQVMAHPKVKALVEALELQNIWVRAALDCKEWAWDAFQAEAAEESYARARAALRDLGGGTP